MPLCRYIILFYKSLQAFITVSYVILTFFDILTIFIKIRIYLSAEFYIIYMKYTSYIQTGASVFCIFTCFFSISCVFSPPASDCLNMTILLPSSALQKTAVISWLSENADVCTLTVDSTIKNEAVSAAVVGVSYTPVLVSIPNEDKTGCIYPITGELSRAGAFCADVLMRILLSSNESVKDRFTFCSFFNWSKLCAKISTYEDPYLLDIDSIAQDIASGTFTAHSLRFRD